MTASATINPAYQPRRFTATAWLLWTIIPPLAISVMSWVVDNAVESVGNVNPASVEAGISAGLIMTLLLVPIVTTLQWLILRRTWPRLSWLAWSLFVIACFVAVFVVLPVGLMNGLLLFSMVPPVLIIAMAAAAVLGIASPQNLRRPAFAFIFLFFLSGGALMCSINTPPIVGVLRSFIFSFTTQPNLFRVFHFIFENLGFLSLACGAAVSGLGLSLTSRRLGNAPFWT